jgi:hypothetical protein
MLDSKVEAAQHHGITNASFHPIVTRGVSHTTALPFTLKFILRQKKNYENSNISPCTKCNLQKKKSSKRNQNPSRYHNSITNLKFEHKPKYHLSRILVSK